MFLTGYGWCELCSATDRIVALFADGSAVLDAFLELLWLGVNNVVVTVWVTVVGPESN